VKKPFPWETDLKKKNQNWPPPSDGLILGDRQPRHAGKDAFDIDAFDLRSLMRRPSTSEKPNWMHETFFKSSS
jgi:hypothetical protein